MNNFKNINNVRDNIYKQKRYINQILIKINPKICIPIIKEVYYNYMITYHLGKFNINKNYMSLYYYLIISDYISFQYSIAAFDSIFDVLFKRSSLTNSSYEYTIENNNYNYYKKCKNRKNKSNRKKYGLGFIHFPDKYDSKKTYTINLNEGDTKNDI